MNNLILLLYIILAVFIHNNMVHGRHTVPDGHPTSAPTSRPSSIPSIFPSIKPSSEPSTKPSSSPSAQPTGKPTMEPTFEGETRYPSSSPSGKPSSYPTSSVPTSRPTVGPTQPGDTNRPSSKPTPKPTYIPLGWGQTWEPTPKPSPPPTCAPTSLPTSKPTARPTSQPTTVPSKYPTTVPTGIPSHRPDATPTSRPTGPTQTPSWVPSGQPSTQPTGQPSTQPTSEPSGQPSGVPSGQPSSQPTGQPSGQPSSQPTGQPSTQPTGEPSGQPSGKPSGQPSALPSGEPSSYPSLVPSIVPSTLPTSVPTTVPISSKPTPKGNTNIPTSNPTRAPQRESVFYNLYRLENYYENAYSRLNPANITNIESEIRYGLRWYKGYNLLGSCDEWNSFRTSGLRIPGGRAEFESVSVAVGYEDMDTEDLQVYDDVTCNNPSVVQELASALTYTYRYDAECAGHKWTVYPCGLTATFCLDCSPDINGCNDLPGTSQLTNPCREGTANAASFSFFSFITRPIDGVLPQLQSSLQSSLNIDKTFVVVGATMTQPGLLYCAAYTLHEEMTQIIDSEGIKARRNYAISSSSSSSSSSTNVTLIVTVVNLLPETDYALYCYPENTAGIGSDLASLLSSRATFTTSCCRNLQFRNSPSHAILSTTSTSSSSSSSSSNGGSLMSFMYAADATTSDTSTTITNHVTSLELHALGRPSGSLTVSLTTLPCDGQAISDMPIGLVITPTTITFLSTSDIPSETLYITSTSTTGGCFKLRASGTHDGYETYESADTEIQVIGVSDVNHAPAIATAVFADDLHKIVIAFDSATDKATSSSSSGSSNSFTCTDVLNIGDKQAHCVWQSDSILYVYSNSTIIGESINIKSNTLRASCHGKHHTVSCDEMTYSDPSLLATIAAPVNGISPVVGLSTPVSVGSCEDINVIVDPTSTYGHAGRDWQSLKWSVSVQTINSMGKLLPPTSIVNASANNISSLLNSDHLTTAEIISIPRSDFQPGLYTISLEVVNFIGKSNFAISKITVSKDSVIPMVRIGGPPVVSTYSSQTIELVADAVLPACASTGIGSRRLTFDWKVYKGVQFLQSIKSTSKDARIFRLDPNTLDAASSYTIQVLVTANALNIKKKPFSTATVTVNVGEQGVIAIISGGLQQSRSINAIATIDASPSYDQDYNMLSSNGVGDGRNDGLTYAWKCSKVGVDCSSLSSSFAAAVATATKTLHIPSGGLDVGVYDITVVVSNSRGRISSATTRVSFIHDVIPLVTFDDGTIGRRKKHNPNERLIINATLSLPASATTATTTDSSIKVIWSSASSQLDTTSLKAISLRPLESEEVSRVRDSGELSHQLSLAPNSLTPGSRYSFLLSSSSSSSSSGIELAQIDIEMNQAPQGGSFTSTPTLGSAFTTPFLLRALAWNDDPADYPITYSMTSYASPSSGETLLKKRDTLSFATVYLSAGLESMGNIVTCKVMVSDIYNCHATATTTAQVALTMTPTQISAFLPRELLLATELTNPELKSQLISAAALAISVGTCFDAQSNPLTEAHCAALGREPCSTVSGKCGECLEGYLGLDGHSLSPCLSQQRRTRNLLTVNTNNPLIAVAGAFCISGSDCLSGSCDTSNTINPVCTQGYKTCENDCSSRGSCMYDIRGNITTIPCVVEDIHCIAVCVCDANSYSNDCSLSSYDINKATEVHDDICNDLYKTYSISSTSSSSNMPKLDLDSAVIESISETITTVFEDFSLISSTAYYECSQTILDIINSHPTTAASGKTIDYVMRSLSAILSKGYPIPNSLLSDISQTVTVLSVGRQMMMSNGEEGSSHVTSKLRLMTEKKSITSQYQSSSMNGTTSSITLNAPLSTLELLLGMERGKVQLETKQVLTSKDIMGFTIILMTHDPDGYALNSSKVHLGIHSYGNLFNISNTIITTDNWYNNTYDFRDITTHQMGCIINDEPYAIYSTDEYACPDGSEFNMTCSGSLLGTFIFNCPGYRRLPHCMVRKGVDSDLALDNSGSSSQLCQVDSYTSTETVCKCNGNGIDENSDGGNTRNLQLIPGISGIHESLEFSSTSFVVNLEIGSNYTAALAYQPPPPSFNPYPLLVIFGFIFFSVILAFGLGDLDYFFFEKVFVPGKAEELAARRQAQSEALEAERLKKHKKKILGHHGHASDGHSSRNHHGGVAHPAHDGLQDEVCEERWYNRYWKVLVRRYVYGGVLSLRRGDQYDLLLSTRFLQMISRLLSLTVGVTIIAYAYFNDDGSCELLRTEGDCLETPDVMGEDTLCEWIWREEYCIFRQPEITIREVAMVAALSFCINSIFAPIFEYTVKELDVYLRIWFKHRVVEYDEEKKAATSYAAQVLQAFDDKIENEKREELQRLRQEAFARGEDWFEEDLAREAAKLGLKWDLEEATAFGAVTAPPKKKKKKKKSSQSGSKPSSPDHSPDKINNDGIDDNGIKTNIKSNYDNNNDVEGDNNKDKASLAADVLESPTKLGDLEVVDAENDINSNTHSNGNANNNEEDVVYISTDQSPGEELKDEASLMSSPSVSPSYRAGNGSDDAEKPKKSEIEDGQEKSKEVSQIEEEHDTSLMIEAVDALTLQDIKDRHVGEFTKLATRQYLYIIAAKLERMKIHTDYVSSRQEAKDVANAKTYEANVGPIQPEIPTFFRRYEIFGMIEQLYLQAFLAVNVQGNSTAAAQLLHAESFLLVLSKIKWSRIQSHHLIESLTHLPLESQRESFIFQMFLVYHLEGGSHRIAYRLASQFFPTKLTEDLIRSPDRFVYMWMYPGLAGILALIALILSIYIGPLSLQLWGISLGISILLDILLVHPLMIWLKHIALPSFARNEIVKLHGLLSYRSRYLMTRVKGHMGANEHSLIQHFNPACRVARLMPDLAASRLLIGLNDFDVGYPAFSRGPTRTHFKYKTSNRMNYVKKSLAEPPQLIISIIFHQFLNLFLYKNWLWAIDQMIGAYIWVLTLLPGTVQDMISEMMASMLPCALVIWLFSLNEDTRLNYLILIGIALFFIMVYDCIIGDLTVRTLKNLLFHHYIHRKTEKEDVYSIKDKDKPDDSRGSFGKGGGGGGGTLRKEGVKVVPTSGDDTSVLTDISAMEEGLDDAELQDEGSLSSSLRSDMKSLFSKLSSRRKAPAPIRSHIIMKKTKNTTFSTGTDSITSGMGKGMKYVPGIDLEEASSFPFDADADAEDNNSRSNSIATNNDGTESINVIGSNNSMISIPILKDGPFLQNPNTIKQLKQPRQLGQLVDGQSFALSDISERLSVGSVEQASAFGPTGSKVLSGVQQQQLQLQQQQELNDLSNKKGKDLKQVDPRLLRKDFHPMYTPTLSHSHSQSMSQPISQKESLRAKNKNLKNKAKNSINTHVDRNGNQIINEYDFSDDDYPVNTTTPHPSYQRPTPLQGELEQQHHVSTVKRHRQPMIHYSGPGPGVTNIKQTETLEQNRLKERLQNLSVAPSDDHNEILLNTSPIRNIRNQGMINNGHGAIGYQLGGSDTNTTTTTGYSFDADDAYTGPLPARTGQQFRDRNIAMIQNGGTSTNPNGNHDNDNTKSNSNTRSRNYRNRSRFPMVVD